MSTLIIQVGNTDNKLTQQDYSDFVKVIRTLITDFDLPVHFDGSSPGDAMWQNHCFVVEDNMILTKYTSFIRALKYFRELYHQDSIAITSGMTEFI